MPILDYPINPTFLLAFAELVLTVASFLFRTLVSLGPIGMALVAIVPTAILSWNVFQGKTVEKA